MTTKVVIIISVILLTFIGWWLIDMDDNIKNLRVKNVLLSMESTNHKALQMRICESAIKGLKVWDDIMYRLKKDTSSDNLIQNLYIQIGKNNILTEIIKTNKINCKELYKDLMKDFN